MIPQRIEKVSRRRSSNTTLTKPSEKLFQTPNPLDSIHPLQNFRLRAKLFETTYFFLFSFLGLRWRIADCERDKNFFEETREKRGGLQRAKKAPDRQTDRQQMRRRRRRGRCGRHKPTLLPSPLLFSCECLSLPLSVLGVAMFLLSCLFPYPQEKGPWRRTTTRGGRSGGVHKLVPTRCPIGTYQVPHLMLLVKDY